MGSTSTALMAHLRLSGFSNGHELIRNRTSTVKVGSSSSSKLRFGVSRSWRRNFDALVCFAAFDGDDVREKQPELGTSSATGLGSAVEDRPGKTMNQNFDKKRKKTNFFIF